MDSGSNASKIDEELAMTTTTAGFKRAREEENVRTRMEAEGFVEDLYFSKLSIPVKKRLRTERPNELLWSVDVEASGDNMRWNYMMSFSVVQYLINHRDRTVVELPERFAINMRPPNDVGTPAYPYAEFVATGKLWGDPSVNPCDYAFAPDTWKWWHHPDRANALAMATRNPVSATEGIYRYKAFYDRAISTHGINPTLIAWPSVYDGAWIDQYCVRILLKRLTWFACYDVKTFASVVLDYNWRECSSSSASERETTARRKNNHTEGTAYDDGPLRPYFQEPPGKNEVHCAEWDATMQGNALINLFLERQYQLQDCPEPHNRNDQTLWRKEHPNDWTFWRPKITTSDVPIVEEPVVEKEAKEEV